MKARQITKNDLLFFCGTTRYYWHWSRKLVFTDGIKFLSENAGAYWLIDLVASYQPLSADKHQYWTLKIEDGKYCAECQDYEGKILARQIIEYSDFPVDLLPFTCYLRDRVLFLPTED